MINISNFRKTKWPCNIDFIAGVYSYAIIRMRNPLILVIVQKHEVVTFFFSKFLIVRPLALSLD